MPGQRSRLCEDAHLIGQLVQAQGLLHVGVRRLVNRHCDDIIPDAVHHPGGEGRARRVALGGPQLHHIMWGEFVGRQGLAGYASTPLLAIYTIEEAGLADAAQQ